MNDLIRNKQLEQGLAEQPACISPRHRPTTLTAPAQDLFFKPKQRRIIHNSLITDNFYKNTFLNSIEISPRVLTNFEKKYIPEPNTGCFLWTKTISKSGYGIYGFEKQLFYAHRFSYRLYNGIIPIGKVVRHICNTPACVNPAHLIFGTQQENIMDSVQQGRWHRVKLTPEQVRYIRTAKIRQVELARLFHVTKACINLIIHGKRQAWVGGGK